MAAIRQLRSRAIARPSSPPMESAGMDQVATERARLREQARRGNRNNPVGSVHNLPTHRRSQADDVAGLWPNLLRDSDVLAHCYVPDTEVPDSQVPHGLETVEAQLKLFRGCAAYVEPVDEQDKFIDGSDSSDASGHDSPTPEIDTTLPSQSELSSSGDDEAMDNSQPAGTDSTQAQVGRQLVDKEHVKVLVKSYQKAFNMFKKSKKGVVPSQLIPNKVWKQVYGEYKKTFPSSKFKEDSLKDHLRQSLRDMARVNTEPEEGEEYTPAENDLMEKLMATDSWKARNVLKSRVDAMNNMSGLGKGTSNGRGSSGAPSEASGQANSGAATSNVGKEKGPAKSPVPICKPPTKSQNLKDARADMAAMLGEFKAMTEDRMADTSRKRMLAEGKTSLQEAKRHESEARVATLTQQKTALEEQAKMGRLNLLKEQKALGLISDLEFQAKCREVFGL